MNRPYTVNTIATIYHPGVSAGLPDGREVLAVALPYEGRIIERIQAAWWVITGRAHALIWPAPGDLERASDRPRHFLPTSR